MITYNIKPSQVRNNYGNVSAQPQQSVQNLWRSIFNNRNILNRFAGRGEWWKPILYNTQLSPQQKFELILGVQLSQVFPEMQLLGDVFEWISNLFSNQNLQQAENWIRQGQNVANQISTGLNVIRNSPSPEEQANIQQQVQDAQSKVFTTGYAIGQGIWPLAIAGLVLLLIFKK